MTSAEKKRMTKRTLQSFLLGLSLMTSGLNVMGLILSKVSFADITSSYLAPLLVFFGFFQTVVIVINHLKLQ